MPCAQQFLWILRIPIKVLVFAQQSRYWSRQRVPLLHFDICCFKTNLNGCFLTPQPMIFSLPPLPLAPPRLSLIRTPYSCDFRNAQLLPSMEWGLSLIPPKRSHRLGHGPRTFGSWERHSYHVSNDGGSHVRCPSCELQFYDSVFMGKGCYYS